MDALPAAHRARSGGCWPSGALGDIVHGHRRPRPVVRGGPRVPALRAGARRRRAARPRRLPGLVRVDGARHARTGSSRSRDPAFTGVDAPDLDAARLRRAAPTRCSPARCAATSPTRAAIVGTEARIEIDGAFYAPTSFTLIPRDGEPQRFDAPARGPACATRPTRSRAACAAGCSRARSCRSTRPSRSWDDGRGQSLSFCLTTLPIALRGSSSRKRTSRGRLCGASSPATWSIRSFSGAGRRRPRRPRR